MTTGINYPAEKDEERDLLDDAEDAITEEQLDEALANLDEDRFDDERMSTA